jgi:hypothetical protein
MSLGSNSSKFPLQLLLELHRKFVADIIRVPVAPPVLGLVRIRLLLKVFILEVVELLHRGGWTGETRAAREFQKPLADAINVAPGRAPPRLAPSRALRIRDARSRCLCVHV